MTVETQVQKVTVNGNDVATVFSFSPIVIFESTDLVVTHVGTDGTETVLSEGTGTSDYAVTVSDYPGTGSITYPASGSTELATGEQLIIKRVLTLEQTVDLENQGGYFPDTQETVFDKLVMIDLQQQEELDRTLKLPISSTDTAADVVDDILLLVGGGTIGTSGIADGAITEPKLATGAVTNSKIGAAAVTTAKLDDDAVTYAKMQNVSATDRFLGRDTAGAGNVEEITMANARTMLNVENGATADQTGAEIKALYEAEADTNAFTDAEQTKLAGIATGAEVNTVDSVNTQTGAVVLDADDISDAATTNKFTTAAEISKLAGIEAGADVTDTTNVMASIDIGALPQELTPAAGDFLFMEDAGGTLRKVDWDDLPAGGGGSSTFLDLTDTPSAYTGVGGQLVRVNVGETALEFVAAGGGGLDNIVEDVTPQLGGDLDANTFDIQLAPGSAATPSLTFGADLDTGIYNPSSNQIGIGTFGTERMLIQATGVSFTPTLLAPSGSAGAPGYRFSSDTNSGFYSVGTDSVGISTGGTLRVTFNTGNTTFAVPVILSDQLFTRAIIGDYSVQNASPASSAGTLTLDYTTGPDYDLQLAENVTTITVSNPPATGSLAKVTLQLRQPTSGTHAVAFTGYDFGDAGAPTMPTGTGAILEVALWTRDGGSTWYGSTYYEKVGS